MNGLITSSKYPINGLIFDSFTFETTILPTLTSQVFIFLFYFIYLSFFCTIKFFIWLLLSQKISTLIILIIILIKRFCHLHFCKNIL